MTFNAPVNAMQFLLRHGVDMDKITALPKFEDTNDELIGDVLNGAAVFARDVVAPTNWAGDQTPATLEGKDVTASPGFKEAYQAFVESGWQSLAMSPDIGGMGLPTVVSVATNEMVRTKAVDNGDGTYSITGQKIYITWGDHDCADNIIHLVLARLPDSPNGSRGISLFLCPKNFVNEDGSLGDRNDFYPIGLEHKLGIHGSPTCVMEFNGAKGWLVGEVNRGLACMFTMMNEARLFVGVQGVAVGERAYQAALQYSHDRIQGTPPGEEAGEPIVHHPDVRRMLIDMKARLMGARAIAMATAAADDLGDHGRASLLTPITKSYGSDLSGVNFVAMVAKK